MPQLLREVAAVLQVGDGAQRRELAHDSEPATNEESWKSPGDLF